MHPMRMLTQNYLAKGSQQHCMPGPTHASQHVQALSRYPPSNWDSTLTRLPLWVLV